MSMAVATTTANPRIVDGVSEGGHAAVADANIIADAPGTLTLEGDGVRDAATDGEINATIAPMLESHDTASEPVLGAETSKTSTGAEADGAAAAGPADQAPQNDWPIDRSKVDVVRERQSTFIVFIDQEQRVRWLSSFSSSELTEASRSLIARARLIATYPTSSFKDKQYRTWLRMIGESLALALSDDAENSKQTLSMAETFVNARARERARLWYVKASLLAFLTLAIVGILLTLVPQQVSETPSWLDETIGEAVLFGVVGAEFSILLRLNNLQVDPGAGRDAHYVEAVIRILMGAFAAIIAVVAVQADIILSFVDTSSEADNGWLVPTVALLAGVSERIVPGILHKVETSALEEESVVEGAHLGDAKPSDTRTTQRTAA